MLVIEKDKVHLRQLALQSVIADHIASGTTTRIINV
jgi:hypothetical protein